MLSPQIVYKDLYQMSTAIHVKDLAGNVRGTSKSPEQCLLNFQFLGPAPGRDVFGNIWFGFAVGRGQDRSQCQPIDCDFRCERDRQRLGHSSFADRVREVSQ